MAFEILRAAHGGARFARAGRDDIARCEEAGWLSGGALTAAGLEALEPYRVRRAVYFAAGRGERMHPITINTPKPLVRVGEKRVIETTLDALLACGIDDITLAIGYLRDEFCVLKKQYPMLKFIENDNFRTMNSMSSAYLARDLLQSCYVLEADLLLKNPALIQRYQYQSGYLGVPVDKTEDWCLKTGEDGQIVEICLRGERCFHMFGISSWTQADGAALSDAIAETFGTADGPQQCWDVAVDRHIGRFALEVRPCTFDEILEIDTFEELCAVDKAYVHP